MRKRIKKKYIFLVGLIVCICFFLGYRIFGMWNHKTDKSEIYGMHLAEIIEEAFTDLEVVKSADADITYDKTSGLYSIEMSLETIGKVSEEEIEAYKRVLGNYNEFAEMALKINGEYK